MAPALSRICWSTAGKKRGETMRSTIGSSRQVTFTRTASRLAAVGREFYARGWAFGTSGNFSAVLSQEPLWLAITASGLDKGSLEPGQILIIDAEGRALDRTHFSKSDKRSSNDRHTRPSDEAQLHLAVVRARRAGAVLHTHSLWATLLSERHAREGGVRIEGYEMLKGLEGIRSHEHRAWLPILENSQDMAALACTVEATLARDGAAQGFLLRRHGLYTWGRDLATAKRHVEILEFLMEVVGRGTDFTNGGPFDGAGKNS